MRDLIEICADDLMYLGPLIELNNMKEGDYILFEGKSSLGNNDPLLVIYGGQFTVPRRDESLIVPPEGLFSMSILAKEYAFINYENGIINLSVPGAVTYTPIILEDALNRKEEIKKHWISPEEFGKNQNHLVIYPKEVYLGKAAVEQLGRYFSGKEN
ncbi:MAG: hypothetical protein V3V78_02345 [Candidatus Woesearchaeota archaeon]